ncbi:unnamed protein product [Effrenium voratum]|nr:unnamed protein product [Effrenium voratum]
MVTMSTNPSCEHPVVAMRIPSIWLEGLSDSSATFAEVRPGIMVLSQAQATCDLGHTVQINGKAYRHDSRLKLVNAEASEQEMCIPIPPTLFNIQDCKVQKEGVCSVKQATAAAVTLDATARQLISTKTGRSIFAVSGLRTSSSPCATLSRWRQLDCASSSCTASSLTTADRDLVAQALERQDGQYRDVFVSCSSVPAGAVVVLSGGTFQHIHIHEGNIYDFTGFSSQHPGGATAITKWASSGYELSFPSNHPMDRFDSYRPSLGYVGRSGDSIQYLDLPSYLRNEELALELANLTSSPGLSLACPSPGEVANNPAMGHNFHLHVEFDTFQVRRADSDFDFPPSTQNLSRPFTARFNVWLGQALEAKDQLRARTAWALSQILVTGTGGFAHTSQTEIWLHYYDILARHAFGNYLDLLREVTFSPLMGEYLSYLRNSAYDHDQNYPDENYAREVMQLFTIGTVKLNADGSSVLDSTGSPVPTYDNDHIMSFARVFTGLDRQDVRPNMEQVYQERNAVDPMKMVTKWHDAYPKPDLDGNYLGDRWPLCVDLPKGAFLKRGADYAFIGSSYADTDVLSLRTSSSLYQALCNPAQGSCSFPTLVTLASDLTCDGQECATTLPVVVQVVEGSVSAYYRYVPPRCVHFYFYTGQIVAAGGARWTWDGQRKCSNPDIALGGSYCCAGCSNTPPSGWVDLNRTCLDNKVSRFTGNCNASSWWPRSKICEQRCWEEGVGYDGPNCSAEGSYREDSVCGFFQEMVPLSAAQENCEAMGMKICDRLTASTKCGFNGDEGRTRLWTHLPCSLNISVDENGYVAGHQSDDAKVNKVFVHWDNGQQVGVKPCPDDCTSVGASCECPMQTEVETVFTSVPAASELAALTVGAFPPADACSVCDGEVKAYHTSGTVCDAKTIFEYQGRFYRNIRSVVRVSGKSFRNPPVIGFYEEPTERSAIWEIESLLEHLVTHPNTPAFISYRMIQRFTSSNPSGVYVQDVAEAFKTGTYNSKTYSGKYGDLGATMAAILLHPEARVQAGQFREPLIKLTHFLRAMEFEDAAKRSIFFDEVQEAIGQEPFASPTVFNFYRPDYSPSGFPEGKVSPELQIFDSSSAVNFLNGLFSLITHAGVTDCELGLGVDTGLKCSQNSFKLDNNTDINELDLLLTGSRMSNNSREVAVSYGTDFKTLSEAVLLSPEFNALGAVEAMGPRTKQSATGSTSSPRSYKAVVNLYLNGGADSFNLVVPIDCDLHAEYLQVRSVSALANSQLLEIPVKSTQTCAKFAIHHKFSRIRELYNAEQAAIFTNVGSLVEPLTRYEYKDGSKRSCVGLFSHSDQSEAAKTLKCQVGGASPKGVGGRIADALASGSQKFQTSSFSLSGKQTWAEGFATIQRSVDKRGEIPILQGYESRRGLIENITAEKYGNIYLEEYARNIGPMVDDVKDMAAQLANVTLRTTFPEAEGSQGQLLKQFATVAKLISTREERGAERDFFYVELGGFDTHNDAHDEIAEKFEAVDLAVHSLVKELQAQNIFDLVTLVTSSDFGRTLTSNGKGTDHGWAGNYFVVGGSLRGGDIYNKFPSALAEGSLFDAGRGRLIPQYPWESMMLPIAQWMGIDSADQSTVFPNLQNFNSSVLLAKDALFTS